MERDSGEKRRRTPNQKMRDTLECVQWAMGEFGSLCTNAQIPRRDVMRCVSLGLVRSIGDVALCSDDGAHLCPERYREGFVLTSLGEDRLDEIRAMLGDK